MDTQEEEEEDEVRYIIVEKSDGSTWGDISEASGRFELVHAGHREGKSALFILSSREPHRDKWNEPLLLSSPCISWRDYCDYYIVLKDGASEYDCASVDAIMQRSHYFGANAWYSVFGYYDLGEDWDAYYKIDLASLKALASFEYLLPSVRLQKKGIRVVCTDVRVDWAIRLPQVSKTQLALLAGHAPHAVFCVREGNRIEVSSSCEVLHEMGRRWEECDSVLGTPSQILLYCSVCEENGEVLYRDGQFRCNQSGDGGETCGKCCTEYR